MQLYEMQVSKTTITRAEPAQIPRGIIGAVVKLSFSAEWEGLTKTAVFRAGEVTKDVADIQDSVVIPAECAQEEGELLQLGIYGVDAQGTVAIPTLWASIGRITEAADPSGDETTDPSLPVWAQVLEMVKQLEEQGVTQREVEQAVKDFFGGYVPAGGRTAQGGEIFNFYTDPVYTGDNPPKEYPGNTAAKGSHAEGFGTQAEGQYSHAEGWVSTASGGIAHAEGKLTKATGYAAHAEGGETKATSSYTHSEGFKTEANAPYSHAEGEGSKTEYDGTNGKYAHAEGFYTTTTGTAAHAEGVQTVASGYAAHAAGRGTTANCRYQMVTGMFNEPDAVEYTDGRGKYAAIVGGGKNADDRANIYTLDWGGNAEFAGDVYAKGKVLATQFYVNQKTNNIVKNTIDVTTGSDDELMEYIDGVYGQMLNNSARYLIVASGGSGHPDLGGAAYLVMLYRRTADYGVLTAVTYDANSREVFRSRNAGVWGEWEWVNPPMALNTSYRTTKRWMGKAVYQKLVYFGALPNGNGASAAGNREVDVGVADSAVVSLTGCAKKDGEFNTIPIGMAGALGAYAYIAGTNLGVTSISQLSDYEAYFLLEYVTE